MLEQSHVQRFHRGLAVEEPPRRAPRDAQDHGAPRTRQWNNRTLLLDDTRRAAHGEAAAPRRAVFRLTIKLALPDSAYVICDAVRPLPFSRSGEPQLRRLLASASLFLRRDSLLDRRHLASAPNGHASLSRHGRGLRGLLANGHALAFRRRASLAPSLERCSQQQSAPVITLILCASSSRWCTTRANRTISARPDGVAVLVWVDGRERASGLRYGQGAGGPTPTRSRGSCARGSNARGSTRRCPSSRVADPKLATSSDVVLVRALPLLGVAKNILSRLIRAQLTPEHDTFSRPRVRRHLPGCDGDSPR